MYRKCFGLCESIKVKKKYRIILSRNKNLYAASSALSDECRSALDEITLSAAAPCAYLFARWIIAKALSCGIKKIYFLARDGYSIKKAADIILKKENIPIETSYFYCSRHSLRMAAYRFFDDSAYDRLFAESYMLSAFNLLTRAEFDERERREIYNAVGFDYSLERAVLNRRNFRQLCEKLRASHIFRNMLKQKSDTAYKNAVGYIIQEGMGSYEKIGIADLGWTGSMQYTLNRLLVSCGIKTEITGFYFGMLEAPPEAENSLYFTWLFDSENCFTKAWFSQNVIECIFSAPHGSAQGYECTENRFCPVLFCTENNSEIILRISNIISEYTEEISGFTYNEDFRKIALQLLKRLMLTPDRDEAEALDNFIFCDDTSEGYHSSLSSGEKKNLIYAIIHRNNSDLKPYWFYGAVKISNVKFGMLYSFFYYLSELARNIVKLFIRKREGSK